VIGGIILLLLPVLKDDTPPAGVMKTTKKGEVKTVEVDEPKLVVKKEKSQGEKPEEIKIKKVEEKKAADKKVKKKKKEDQAKLIPGKSAMAYFREGNLITAGNIWKQELRKSGIKYTVLLEMDCLIESVVNAYERIDVKENFFILNRKVGERSCFLVMYGKFYTQQAAAEGIKTVPRYFWQQQSPPRIVELSRYL
jgi:septal ring-binding cell division protein DamX